jgi:hypothetical protein
MTRTIMMLPRVISLHELPEYSFSGYKNKFKRLYPKSGIL